MVDGVYPGLPPGLALHFKDETFYRFGGPARTRTEVYSKLQRSLSMLILHFATNAGGEGKPTDSTPKSGEYNPVYPWKPTVYPIVVDFPLIAIN